MDDITWTMDDFTFKWIIVHAKSSIVHIQSFMFVGPPGRRNYTIANCQLSIFNVILDIFN